MDEFQNEDKTPTQYGRIDGWLVLIAIGLIITPIKLLVVMFKEFLPVFSGSTWSNLTTPGSVVYHPLMGPLLIFELIGNLAFVVFAIVVAIFFFKKRKIVPKLMIILLISNLTFVIIDFFSTDLIPHLAGKSNINSIIEIMRVLIACLILVPYFFVSKRVKGTFVN